MIFIVNKIYFLFLNLDLINSLFGFNLIRKKRILKLK